MLNEAFISHLFCFVSDVWAALAAANRTVFGLVESFPRLIAHHYCLMYASAGGRQGHLAFPACPDARYALMSFHASLQATIIGVGGAHSWER